ncbi:6-phosphogluconolactonase [Parabacteroides sp. PF5-6]|uniref:6-phosphogluconolactonase n=1 Tax=Parabacteroides sp. PF5-6 TaxID=1742403 RepID=UPI002405B4DE|nr:6-phosphogluconolactonase [Parabacteroides sp. PF5-6]MDF9829073.1 6-phosphogluconolactonase [Parabacteroides sp. PF5-6]
MRIEDFNEGKEALRAMTEKMLELMAEKKSPVFNLALSGGETAKKMFVLWREEYIKRIDWQRLRFFWVDERCVPETDDASNYGNAKRYLFEPLQIPEEHIHRIRGEEEPGAEAVRYSWEVKEFLPRFDQLPIFDCIILGVGPDSHIASIFPQSPKLLYDSKSYTVSQHPVTQEYRITMTGPLILNNAPLLVPILGTGKHAIKKRLHEGYSDEDAPAAYLLSRAQDATLYVEIED